MSVEDIQLLPCPFCGWSAEAFVRSSRSPTLSSSRMAKINLWTVSCTYASCGAEIVSYQSAGDAARAWNRREPAHSN